MRTQDILPAAIGDDIVKVIHEHGDALERGAIVTLDAVKARIRILPLQGGARGGRPPG